MPSLLGVALLAGVVLAARHFSDARDFVRLAEAAQPWWIAVAVALQVATYLVQGQVFRAIVAAGRSRLALSTASLLSLAKLFVDQAVPSGGLSGTVVLANGLERRGVPRNVVAAAVVNDLASYHIAYVACLSLAVAVTAVHRELHVAILVISAVFLLFALALAGFALALPGRPARPLPRALARLAPVRLALDFVRHADPKLVRNGPLLGKTTLYQLAIVVCDAATVWVLIRSLGGHASPGGVFASFMISTLLRTVGLMPGGLGTFEAASVVTLRMVGVPVAVALAATILFRGLSFWLPMLPGLWLSRSEMRAGRRQRGIGRRLQPDPALDALTMQLGASLRGLSSVEAQRRLQAGGPNEPAARSLRARALEVARALGNPLLLVLLAASGASVLLGQVRDGIIIVAIVLLGGVINLWQTARSQRAVGRLQHRIAPNASVLRDGVWTEVPRRHVVAGDIVRLSAGDLVPADARLIEATDLHVQQGALTGESMPAAKAATAEPLTDKGPDSPALVFLGTSVVSGSATALVFAAGRDTAFGDIVERLAARPDETEFERGARRFGMLILQAVVALVLFILVVNVSLGRNALESLLFSIALAVGLTPEFLPMITTVTLAQGAVRMAREKVIVKHLAAIQNLGSIDILCSDKTGTLTSGTMSLDAAHDPLGAPSQRAFVLACLNARFESGIKSPLDAAILACAPSEPTDCTKAGEVPFDFERRRLSVAVEKAGDRLLITKGAPESVIAACTTYEVAGDVKALDPAAAARCLAVFRAMSERGLRVLAVAFRRLPEPRAVLASDECELTLVGFLTFADHLLDGVAESIESLRRDGVQVRILTGDNELVTRHICAQAGIPAGRIVVGAELERMDEATIARVAEGTQVFARVSPAQKHRIVRALRAHGHVVGYLGDGINDAPSLHAADVGISVADAVDVAREASDIVLLERKLAVLHAGVLAGRRAFGNVLKYLLMGTSSNFGNMFSMAGAALFLPFLPMLPTQILLNNFLYDLAQITIPSDNVDPVYVRRPQRWDMGLIRRFMLLIGPVSSAYDLLTFFVLLRIFRFDATLFHTGWFLESLATQTLVLFVIRTAGRPWRSRPSLPLTVTTLLVVIIGAVLPFTRAAAALGFAPLPPAFFGFLTLVTATYLVVVELVKRKVMRRLVGG